MEEIVVHVARDCAGKLWSQNQESQVPGQALSDLLSSFVQTPSLWIVSQYRPTWTTSTVSSSPKLSTTHTLPRMSMTREG